MNGPGLSDLSNYNEMGYGHLTLDIVRKKCAESCKISGLKMDFRQTDDEAELSRFLKDGIEDFDALIINPAGYSHTPSVDYTIIVLQSKQSLDKTSQLSKCIFQIFFNKVLKILSQYKFQNAKWVL